MQPGEYYHIFNRGINKGLIFFEEENYTYFLQQFKKYVSEYVDVFAYCLRPNHFHFFIRIKELAYLPSNTKLTRAEKAFRDFFISYARTINKHYNRTGALFQYKFKRKEIDSISYFTWLIYYIHANPIKAGLCAGLSEWRWSSYLSLISSPFTLLQRDEVIRWFGSKEELVGFHTSNLREDFEQQEFIQGFE